MRVTIVSHQVELYSNQRLSSAARARGHTVCVLDPLSITPSVGVPMACIGDCDVVVPRVVTLVLDHSLLAVSMFEQSGVPCLNAPSAIAAAANKFTALCRLADAGIAVPRSCLPRDTAALRGFARQIGSESLVLKVMRGFGGDGVMEADTLDVAQALLETWLDMGRCVLVQERIRCEPKDLRVVVVRGEVFGAIERTAAEGDFRANVSAGGTARAFAVDVDLEGLSLAATAALGLEVCGVDVLLSDSGPVVTEVNACPGLKAFEEATGLDLADRIMVAAEEVAKG